MNTPDDSKQPADYRAYRAKVVEDALSKTKFRPKPKTQEEEIVDRAKQITIQLRQAIKPILQAGGWKDRASLTAIIHKMYLEAFNMAFNKEELAILTTIVHVEVILDIIDANPWGGDKPEEMSGV